MISTLPDQCHPNRIRMNLSAQADGPLTERLSRNGEVKSVGAMAQIFREVVM